MRHVYGARKEEGGIQRNVEPIIPAGDSLYQEAFAYPCRMGLERRYAELEGFSGEGQGIGRMHLLLL